MTLTETIYDFTGTHEEQISEKTKIDKKTLTKLTILVKLETFLEVISELIFEEPTDKRSEWSFFKSIMFDKLQNNVSELQWVSEDRGNDNHLV